jgi:hypothetical protein
MSTSLTAYRANTASSVLSTANKLYHAAAGAPSVNQLYTLLGTATGFGTVYSQGTTNTWPGAGSLPGANGSGYFIDDGLLDGQTIAAGNWSATVRYGAAIGTGGTLGGSFTADIYVSTYRYRSGVYTLIVSMVLTNQTINATITTYNLPSTSAASMDFASGDRLYVQDDLNILTNASGSTENIRINRLSTATVTLDGDPAAQIVTPGYDPTPVANQIYLIRQHAAIGSVQ